ncbi:MAG: hypothetical protein US53_C0018G0011 [Candidatus Woesebacteria bacterium GW2011_GWA1_37_7]|uniref:Uncharacterized protein n=1 Tax=Candidatus Woesebacteria bacterium GW2011_GWA1_37_7 TaxID=1618545 RepID=A0A0G0H2H5_9BACT|nr:MAG: hypothetical protein US53_C0018G0011 [Candidatus Woesebacteria bacterium GW2011_GWA1_37_7]
MPIRLVEAEKVELPHEVLLLPDEGNKGFKRVILTKMIFDEERGVVGVCGRDAMSRQIIEVNPHKIVELARPVSDWP